MRTMIPSGYHRPLLMIGMPVYNGEKYLARALDSLIAQECRSWNLRISDNKSSDRTREIAEEYARKDSRISYFCHEKNLGAVNNFIGLAALAGTPYFMWAAADDEWSSNYVSSCVSVLELQPDVSFVGGGVCNTDDAGNCIRTYQPFSDFDTPSVKDRVSRFLEAIEANGKANIIYSVFRTELIQILCRIPNIFDGWGADMAFVAAGLSRGRYRQVNQATIYKRVVSESDISTAKLLNEHRHSEIEFGGNFPPSFSVSYMRALINGMPSLDLRFLALKITLGRLIRLSLGIALGRR